MVRETRHLWVGNLPHTIREERILDHFKRYGKVQSVKILPKKEDDSGGACATVAFIDIKSAAKAHNADNKIEDRTLKTDYYEPPASSTASSAIYIHERDDALVRNPTASYSTPRTPRYGLSEERNYERPGHYYNDRESYLRRPLGMGYHDEDNYQGRAKSRDRYSRSNSGSTYTEGTERNQNHFRSHNTRQHFDPQRYPVGEQYSDEREPAGTTPRLSRRTNNSTATPVVASVASPTTTRSESRPRRTKRRSPSRTPSGSRSNSGSRSRSRSSSGSRSSSSSSKLRSTSSDSSGRSRSPSKSRSPAASYGSQSNAKGSRLDRPSSAIANPSSTVCYLPSAVNTSAINCTSNNTQGSTPTQGCPCVDSLQNNCDKEEKRPLGICVRNLPVRSTDTSLKDGLFHEYKKHGKVTMVKVIGQGTDRYAVVCFKKPEDVDKALEVSKDKLFFGCKIEVTAHEGLDAEDNEFRPLEAELDEYHPKATRTLFIGNLEKDITTAELRKHFDQFGEIIEIDIKKQGSATSYAFIQYSDIASVVKAMRKLDGENLGANRIKLGFGKSMPTNCVWLDGIVDSVSDKFLTRHFNRFGIVVYTAVDREKGHALVFYESVEFAQIAVSEMRGRILQGKKLQVDFASRECQTTFFDKLEMTGQMIPGDGTRPWERRERRGPEFEVVRNDDRETRVGFENRAYTRYEGQPRANRGNFRGNQRTGFPGRGRGQNFSGRYEYHDEFGERRHRYNSRDESGSEATLFDGKIERLKYADNPDCPNRKRNKLRNSISDQESHHSQSPPRSRHQSRSTSPVSKERKSLKDRLHHRIKSPSSHNSSLVNSPCRDTLLDDLDTNSEYRDSRSKSCDAKMEDLMAELSYTSPRSSSEKEGSEKMLIKSECDSFRSRSSLDAESADEAGMTSDQLGQLERKKRLLASSSVKCVKDIISSGSKSSVDKTKPKNSTSHNSIKSSRVNCLSEATVEELKLELESVNVQYECAKEKSQNDCANSEMKYLKKKQVQILHLLDQLHEGVNSSDNDCSVDGERLCRKKHRSSSTCLEANSICESDVTKSHTKDDCGSKLCKSGIKDPTVLSKLKKMDTVEDSNCVSLSLDSFIFSRKHLDPRKGFDQHSVLAANSLPKCRRISVDNDSCLPNTHGTGDSFLCVSTAEVSWKKHSLSDVNFSETDNDSSIALSNFKLKDEHMEDETVNKKISLSLSMRSYPDSISCHEIKRERDISPLSLPLPKFAASLRSPKSSPSIVTSPKSMSAHSPRAGHSPSYASSKSIRIPDLFHDIPCDKKIKDIVPEDKMNGATSSPPDSSCMFFVEPHTNNDTSESIPSVEPIQSPKSNCDKIIKEIKSSSGSEQSSPVSSPNRPSIEDRIKALDEKFNAWSGSTRSTTSTVPDVSPSSLPDLTPKCSIKRSRFSYLTETRKEPSEIVKSLLARSTIFDQDSKRLQHIDEKYEPLSVKMDLSPKVKPAFRTKAAAKEFSTPITPAIQSFSQSILVKSPATVMVAQGIISPPATPQSTTNSILSPVTPVPQYTQLPPSVFTPCSPRATSFPVTPSLIKAENVPCTLEKDISEQILKSPQVFNSVKAKVDPNFHANSAALATSLKSSPLTCPVETPSHGSMVTSFSIKKEPASPTEAVTDNVCKVEIECKVPVKKEVMNSAPITVKKESSILSITKEHSHFNSIDQDKKEFCDSKDPRLSFNEEVGQWRENVCKDEIKTNNADSSAKSFTSDLSETSTVPAAKKRVSSIDSNESDSSKSLKSLESSRDSQENNWSRKDSQEKLSEPEPKRPKLNKSARERSVSPPVHQLSKKSDKKDKTSKTEKNKSVSKPTVANNPDKVRSDVKCNSKNDYKDKPKAEHKTSKDDKRSKSKDSKDSGSKSEARSKPQERRNSEKDSKSSNSSSTSNTKSNKKETSNKNEKSNEKKNEKKSTSRSKNNDKFDFSAFMIDDEPVYFSMYDKVKARSSKSQTLKHQTTNDLETVRQKFSKLKQSRAKREEKSKSIDQDSDKDTDSSHHTSESESETKPVKAKQQRKRKLVIESSSDEDRPSQENNSQSNKTEKNFQSESATDSDFDYNVAHRQSTSKSRRKKTELLDSDSSDSDSNFPSKPQQSSKKKSAANRSKSRLEKSKKLLKSEDDNLSEPDTHKNQKNKEKDKSKKVKKDKEAKVELEVMECDISKRLSDEPKNTKKKLKETKSETDLSPVQKKFKSDFSSKEKASLGKEKKVESSNDKIHSSEEVEKHKPYSKKRKKSKKMSRNKDKRSEKSQDSSRKQLEESDTKSSLPILLSPKPSSPLPDKQLSPPCLQAGVLSDNDFKSDFSDFDYDNQPAEEIDTSRDMWKHLETKSETNSEKSSKNKKKENVVKSDPAILNSPEQDSSLPSFFDKLSDITDSETGREASDFTQDVAHETPKQTSFNVRKEKESFRSSSPHKSKHEKHEDQTSKHDSNKYSDNYTSPPKEERRKKKSKKQSKERKKKSKEESHTAKDEIIDSTSVSSPKPSLFETVTGEEDSRLSDIRLDEEIAEEARRLEQELLAASEETSTFGDDGPAKREEKLLERRFEEEAAKETRRLEEELMSTGRDSWHMKEKEYDSEANTGDLCDDKHASEIDSLMGKDDNIFAGLELHSSVAESSQNEADVFLSGHSESDPYKIDDKDVINEIEDQRKIEDDLAVSALLQEMNCGEIPAPELTKEGDYLDMEAHPDETMNYLLPDDGENSLHIADSSPDNQGNDSQDGKLESSDVVLSPSSNSEPPPALEISNVEDVEVMKVNNENQVGESLKSENAVENIMTEHKTSYDLEDNNIEHCESKPPIIDLPNVQEKASHLDSSVSPKSELSSALKKKQNEKPFRMPSKPDTLNNDDTDDESSSDLTENQLTHFEDITNDTADSKDDDNPPILLPVQSPPNLLPVSSSKDQMEPLDKVSIDDNQCLDRIIGKAPASGESIFDKVTDLDKQIGDIINSITELKSKNYEENDSFRMGGSHNISELPGHGIADPLGLSSSSNLFDPPKSEGHSATQDFDPEEILKPSGKETTSSESANLSNNFTDESANNKYDHPQSSSCVLENSILNYSEMLSSSCEATSVIQSAQKMDSDAVTISITEKNEMPTNQQFSENRVSVSDTNHASDNFILELFGPKSEETFKIEPPNVSRDKDKSTENEVNSETKNKAPEPELPPINFGLQQEIKPLFEIPEINEQNEATEFNQEIFERPSDTNKDPQIPRLLSFSSEHLFPDNSSVKKDTVSECSEEADVSTAENQDSIVEDKSSKPEPVDPVTYPSVDHDSNKETDQIPKFEEKSEDINNDSLNIEESLENKSRPVDAESVCSDTTDITIPETKIESESSLTVSVEEQATEDVCPTDEIEMSIKPKVERPRRGRRPKTRRYVEAVSLKQDPSADYPNPPVNMRITRRGSGRLTSSERPRRSLRSDTSESIILRDDKHSVDESGQSEIEEIKKDDDIIELPINSPEPDGVNLSNSSRFESESKSNEKAYPTRSEEPRKRRGRRKKNSGDRSAPHVGDKIEQKAEEHEPSKDYNRPKESRLLFSLSDRDQKSTNKESTVDVYEFIVSSEDEATSFESVKEKLHDNSRANIASTDSKHESKLIESVFDKKEKVTEDQKSKTGTNEKRDAVSKEQHTPSKDHHSTFKESNTKEHHVAQKETPYKEHMSSKENVSKEHHIVSKDTSKEPASKEQQKKRSKLSMVIRIGGTKDGHDGIAEVIKTSEAIDESKSESTKPERNTSSKHETTSEIPHNGPITRKSSRLKNQALSTTAAADAVREDVKGNSKSNNANNSNSHAEPVQTRATRRSRSSRRSEESLPVPSDSSEDVSEDKNKNEPVFFIPDNTVKEDKPDTKKSSAGHGDMTPVSDSLGASESDKTSDKAVSLRTIRILRSHTTRSTTVKLESNKNSSQSSVPPVEAETPKKEPLSLTSAEDKFDALQKESKEIKETKDIKTTSSENSTLHQTQLPVLKVELPRIALPTAKDDSEYRSSPAALIDPETGFLVEVKSSETFSVTPSSAPSTESKNSNLLVSDASGIAAFMGVKVSVAETSSVTTVIHESSKTSQLSESTPVRRGSRSRQQQASQQIATTQSSMLASTTSDAGLKAHSDKTIEHVKLPAKKAASSAVPVLTITNPAVSSPIVTSSDTLPVSNSSSTPTVPTVSLDTKTSVTQPPVITSVSTPVTTTLTELSNFPQEKKDVQASGLSKISHSSHRYQPSVRAIVTPVVTQMSAGHSAPLPSSVQTKCSINTTCTTSSSVLTTPELPVEYSSANIPPTSVTEHISNISSKPSSVSSEQSNIPLSKETHIFTTSSAPVTTTWAGSKVSSNRLIDVQGHVSAIQTSSSTNPVYTKSDSRSSKVAHPKNTSAFSQQPGFPLNYDPSVLTSAHNIAGLNANSGIIAELLQNPQLLQQTHFAAAVAASGQLQDRIQSQVVRAATPVAPSLPPEITAARRGNPTPPHTPTPPVSSANHSPLLIHTSQIVPPHLSLPIHHPSELNPYVHLFPGAALNPYAGPMHSDMRAQQEAQVRAAVIGMNPRYAYPIPPAAVPSNSFRQPTDSRLQPPVMDPKSDPKLNDLSKIVHENRGEEKSLHSVKSGRKKEDKEVKVIHSDREELESRHIPAHEKTSSTSAITPHPLRQQQHAAHYSSTIRQVSPHLTPHEQRHTDSPIVANLYAAGQSRVPQISIPGQVDDHRAESLSLSSHHYKSDATQEIKPPIAHQTQLSTIPYHSLDAAVHQSSRQQMLGVLQIGSPAPGHIDSRTANPALSPSSHTYKKDSTHSQSLPSILNPATDKRMNSEHSKKVVHTRTLSHQGSSISPGPAGMGTAHSPLPWQLQPHNSHSNIAQQSPHVILPTNEPSRSRSTALVPAQMGSEVQIHAPPPAHAMSQPSNVPRTLPQTPPHASQVPSHDAYILRRYPVMWQGLLALKNDQAVVQMHFVSGNPLVARASLPPIVDGDAATVRISQRMRLDPTQLDGVYKKIQLVEEHCILMALPCGKDQNDVVQQSSNLKSGFIHYLTSKNAAGIVNAATPGSQQPAFVIHIFPSCEFIESNLSRIAPSLLHLVNDISHLVIIIATV